MSARNPGSMQLPCVLWCTNGPATARLLFRSANVQQLTTLAAGCRPSQAEPHPPGA